jgi:hypothetical protein
MEEELRQALGTRVRVVGTLGRGRIELPYSSPEELDRIHGRLTGGALDPVPGHRDVSPSDDPMSANIRQEQIFK